MCVTVATSKTQWRPSVRINVNSAVAYYHARDNRPTTAIVRLVFGGKTAVVFCHLYSRVGLGIGDVGLLMSRSRQIHTVIPHKWTHSRRQNQTPAISHRLATTKCTSTCSTLKYSITSTEGRYDLATDSVCRDLMFRAV